MSTEIFKIEVLETLSETIEIEAKDLNEAILKAKKMYNDEEIVLGEQNYINTEFKIYE
ncbi:DpnD/PcfM family protein [Hwangdonia seohaensis]|uniref:DpnD/PcfM family protein n=1 Tax=Hwangdonia seohaensis TaxID=1240727 RepID=A0ABW3R892_9FLAO|nr:DpnD/PcfM family protein [Hwangdonia seohaensis]